MVNREDAEKASEPKLDDRSLIAGCLEGDSDSWESLILRYQRLIYSIPIRSGFSPVDAADIFQSVCVRLLEHLDSLRNHEKISSWLMTTTARECWRLVARRRREGQTAIYGEDYENDILNNLAAAGPSADEQRIAFERQQIVREGVAALSERCREMIKLLFYSKEEVSYAEVARLLNIPANSVGPTRARCLQKLRKLLENKF